MNNDAISYRKRLSANDDTNKNNKVVKANGPNYTAISQTCPNRQLFLIFTT